MRIAVLDDWAGVARDMADWGQVNGEITFFTDPIPTADLSRTLAPFQAICVMRERTPLPADLIAALPELRLIVTTGPRNAAIDLDAARARGVTVCATQSRKTTTSELALAMILHQIRGLGAEMADMDAGGFRGLPGRDLADLRVGLIGLGTIGAQMAELCRAFGASVSAWSPNLTQARCDEVGVTHAHTLNALAAGSDVISLHMVLSGRSAGLLDAPALAALPRGALVVNTSRAGLLDRDALLDWLARDDTAMAAIDVFEQEPPAADDPWRQARARFGHRLMLTPHLGYVTQATWRVFYEQTVEALAAFQAGTPIRVL